MKNRKGFGQIIITAMFVYSAILCHFHASSMLENGDKFEAILFWFFCFTAILGSLRFKIAYFIEKNFLKKIKKNSINNEKNCLSWL